MKEIAKVKLKIHEIGKMREQIVRFKKYEVILSAVLSILSLKWYTDSFIILLLIKKSCISRQLLSIRLKCSSS